MKLNTKDMSLGALFAALICICSWIAVPAAVPFTMQTFAVFLSVALCGGRRGTLAVAIYILLGAAGLPVFSGFKGGLGALFGVTGGYIFGFLFSAMLMWFIIHRLGEGKAALILAMAAGLLLCYGVGTAWFLLVYTHSTGAIGIMTVLGSCVLPFIVPDLLKMALAYTVCARLKRVAAIRNMLS